MTDGVHASEDITPARLDHAGLRIGRALIVITTVEKALDIALTKYFGMIEATFAMLPMIDFRSKMEMVTGDELLTSIFGKTVGRLHALYDARNVIAHGYVNFPVAGVEGWEVDPFEVRLDRRGRVLKASDVDRVESDAMDLVGCLMEIIEEVEAITSLKVFLADHPQWTAEEIFAQLRIRAGASSQ